MTPEPAVRMDEAAAAAANTPPPLPVATVRSPQKQWISYSSGVVKKPCAKIHICQIVNVFLSIVCVSFEFSTYWKKVYVKKIYLLKLRPEDLPSKAPSRRFASKAPSRRFTF